MVNRLSPLVDRRFGRADVQATVDLHGIRTDDLAAELPGQFYGESCLAHGRGAADDNQLLWI